MAVDSNGAEFVGNKFNHKQTNIKKNTQLYTSVHISNVFLAEFCMSRSSDYSLSVSDKCCDVTF